MLPRLMLVAILLPLLRAADNEYRAANISRIMTSGSSGRQGMNGIAVGSYGPYTGYQEPVYYPTGGSGAGSPYGGEPDVGYQYPSYIPPEHHHSKPYFHAMLMPTESSKSSWLAGLLKTVLAVLGAELVLKIPLLLLKLLLKLVLAPLGLLFLGAPMLPLLTAYLLPAATVTVSTTPAVNITSTTTTSTTQPSTRRQRAARRWTPCAARIACQLGEGGAGSELGDTVARILEQLHRGAPEGQRLDLKALHDAYLAGASLQSCGQHLLRCPDPYQPT